MLVSYVKKSKQEGGKKKRRRRRIATIYLRAFPFLCSLIFFSSLSFCVVSGKTAQVVMRL